MSIDKNKVYLFTLALIILVGLYLASLVNYLFFHTLAEMFSIVIGFSVFILAWNSRNYQKNGYLLFIGTASLFSAAIDLVHTLVFKGMNIFPGYDANLPTQLWIASRYIQSLSFLIAPFFIHRQVKISSILTVFTGLITLLFLSTFVWKNFPTAYIEGVGLTQFKIISEYVIIGIFLGSIALLYHSRAHFDQRVVNFLVGSIMMGVAADVAFTTYVSVYGFSNLLGHYFKILSFYLLYKTLIETGIEKPFALLFRDLKRNEEELRLTQAHLESLVEKRTAELTRANAALKQEVIERHQAEQTREEQRILLETIVKQAADGIVVCDASGNLTYVNTAARRVAGIPVDADVKTDTISWGEAYDSGGQKLELTEWPVLRALRGETTTGKEMHLVHSDGRSYDILISAAPLVNAEGDFLGSVGTLVDISARKRAEEALRSTNLDLENRVTARTSELQHINEQLAKELSDRKRAEEALSRIEWQLTKSIQRDTWQQSSRSIVNQPYGDLSQINTSRVILDAVGEEVLADVVSDYLDLLETSATVYEKTGDYAFGIFSSGWCQFLDLASRELCPTSDNREALGSGKWICRETCWKKASLQSINAGQPVDIECEGGLHIYAVPIIANSEVVGSITVGYGDPPRDIDTLSEIADKYGVDKDILRQHAESYESRPPFMIDLAKNRLTVSSRLIGALIERKWAEDALRRSESRLRRLVDSNIIGVIYENDQGDISNANQAFLEMVGFSKEELDSGNIRWTNLTPKEQLPFSYRAFEEARTTGACTPFEKEYICKNGQRIPVLIGFAKLDSDSREYVGFVLNLSELKRAQHELSTYTAKLERSNRELQNFAFVASHDLQEPLRKIEAFADRLRMRTENLLGNQEKDYMDRMLNATSRMRSMIDGLLSLSRVTTQAQPFCAVDLFQIASEVISDLDVRIEKSGGTVELGNLPIIEADPLQMRQLLQNLIGNALKFHKPDVPPAVKVYSRLAGTTNGEDPQSVQILVEDNGIGFNEDQVEKIFQPFNRLHGKSQYEGNGIGLAICDKIVERHFGTVTARSTPGVGSVFIVTIPVNHQIDPLFTVEQ